MEIDKFLDNTNCKPNRAYVLVQNDRADYVKLIAHKSNNTWTFYKFYEGRVGTTYYQYDSDNIYIKRGNRQENKKDKKEMEKLFSIAIDNLNDYVRELNEEGM